MPLLLLRPVVFRSPRRLTGRLPRWPLLLSVGLIAVGSLGCRPAARPQAPPSSAQAGALKQELVLRQCQQRRRELMQDLADLRRAEAELADRRAELPPPLPSPPVWDEAAEQRYSQVDQELDRQRYEQDLAAWQQRRADHRARVALQRQREAPAQQRLNDQAQRLQQRYPGLFTAPGSIEIRPQELERLSRCPSGPG
jgi:hypothetical protein